MNSTRYLILIFLILGHIFPGKAQSGLKLAPAGFDALREDGVKGDMESREYHSITVGSVRKVNIYTPPGYSEEKNYPVLYLLHGIGGDENEWLDIGKSKIILDNLYSENKLVPMIVVFPNGRAMKDDKPGENIFDSTKIATFSVFEQDLLGDLIPFVEEKYSVSSTREDRAIAGLSMGGGQALNFGLGNPERFSWIGGFSSAPNTKMPEELVYNPGETSDKLNLLWISCGDKDGLLEISEGIHTYLLKIKVPHIYFIEPGDHDFKVWRSDIYLFTQYLFK